MSLTSLKCILFGTGIFISSCIFSQPGGGPYSLIDLGDGLFQVSTGPGVSPVSMILVTDEGIAIIDPPNPATAEWIQEQIQELFPEQQVLYVIESHYHWDHIRGADAFSDTASYISHINLPGNLDASIQEAPPPGDTRDENGDGRLTREEARTGTLANFDAMDTNTDGFLTQEELAPAVRPDIVFSDKMELNLGGKRIVLIWAGNRHTNDLIDVYFPDHKVLFAGDYIWINRMCCNFQFDRRPLDTWIDSIRNLENLDFDILVNSHFDSGSKTDLIAFRRWLEDLKFAVSSGIADGMSLEEIQSAVRLQDYSDWVNYDAQLEAIIESAYGSLMLE